jgi:predicted secreted Zn-dependent protease
MAASPSAREDLEWRKSRTCDGGACVVVSRQDESILIANSGQLSGPFNIFTRAEWKEFVAGVKLGDFDDLA